MHQQYFANKHCNVLYITFTIYYITIRHVGLILQKHVKIYYTITYFFNTKLRRYMVALRPVQSSVLSKVVIYSI